MMFYKETNFKETPAGKIPKDWEVAKLEEFLSLDYGRGLPEKKRVPGKYPVVGSNGIVGYHNQALVKGPGIVIGRKGTMGAVSWIDSDFWPIDTTYYVKVRKEDISLKWLFFELIHVNLSKLHLADVVPGLKRELAYSLKIPLLPLSEQQKIAEILSTVDEAIQKVDEVTAKTERLKKGLMQELLTKGIGHKEFKDTEIGSIPKDWGVARLGDIITYEKGRKPNLLFNKKKENTLPYLTADNMRTGIFTQWTLETNDIIKANEDDLLLIWDGFYCGEAFIGFKGVLSSTMIKIKPKSRNLNKYFLFYSLKPYFKILNTQIAGMYLKHVSKFVFESLKLPLPPLLEQQKIAEILSTIDKKLELERNEKTRLERIKQGLMGLLLTGKIRVRV